MFYGQFEIINHASHAIYEFTSAIEAVQFAAKWKALRIDTISLIEYKVIL